MKKENQIPIVVNRRLVKQGDSYYVAMPPDWIRQHKLEPGVSLVVIANADVRILSPTSETRKDVYKKISGIVEKE